MISVHSDTRSASILCHCTCSPPTRSPSPSVLKITVLSPTVLSLACFSLSLFCVRSRWTDIHIVITKSFCWPVVDSSRSVIQDRINNSGCWQQECNFVLSQIDRDKGRGERTKRAKAISQSARSRTYLAKRG